MTITVIQKMVRFNRKGQQAYDNQQWLIKIIKTHAQISRESPEGYYIIRVVQQFLLALDKITDLHQDIIYLHQIRNGKIISFPKFRIVDPTTTTEELTTTQTTSATTKEQIVTTSLAATTEVATTTISTTTKPEIDWEKVN